MKSQTSWNYMYSSRTGLREKMVSMIVILLALVLGTASSLVLLRNRCIVRWGPLRPFARPPPSLSSGNSPAVEDGVSLASLTDPDVDGAFLNAAVVQWLDGEYIVQDVHRTIGAAVQTSYARSRRDGASDLGEVMMNVGTTLEGVNMRDAFVNAWDVANKVWLHRCIAALLHYCVAALLRVATSLPSGIH